MSEKISVVVWRNGKLEFPQNFSGGEVMLALPLSRLIVKMVAVKNDEDAMAVATATLQPFSPYPDEPLTVGLEIVREDRDGKIVLAAALPESSTDDLGEALDAAKLSVVRIDLEVLGRLRVRFAEILGEQAESRRALIIAEEQGAVLFVLDGDKPLSIRTVSTGVELRRELMLSLIEAEDFGGAGSLSEIVTDGVDVTGLSDLAPIRSLAPLSEDMAWAGLFERLEDNEGLNALPLGWRDQLTETRFKAKLKRFLAVAGAIWLLVMAILLGVPMVYNVLTGREKDLIRAHRRRYEAVSEMREKVRLVQKYSNRDHSALELLRQTSEAISTNEVTLSSWSFKRGEGLRLAGEANGNSDVYNFKDSLEKAKIFDSIELTGPISRSGGVGFSLECKFFTPEEQ